MNNDDLKIEEKGDQVGMDFVLILPPEATLTIFSFLSISSLVNVTCVSKRWKRMSEDQILWKKLLECKLGLPLSSTGVCGGRWKSLYKEATSFPKEWSCFELPQEVVVEGCEVKFMGEIGADRAITCSEPYSVPNKKEVLFPVAEWTEDKRIKYVIKKINVIYFEVELRKREDLSEEDLHYSRRWCFSVGFSFKKVPIVNEQVGWKGYAGVALHSNKPLDNKSILQEIATLCLILSQLYSLFCKF